jgi:hypothetical protein
VEIADLQEENQELQDPLDAVADSVRNANRDKNFNESGGRRHAPNHRVKENRYGRE